MTADTIIEIIKKIIDISLVWGLLYFILKSLRKSVKKILIFKGVIIIILIKIISNILDLVTIGFLIDYVIQWAPIAIIIIFQPEIRDALEQLGKTQLLGRHKMLSKSEREETVNEIITSLLNLKSKKMGALIVIERNNSLAEYINKAQPIYAKVREPLLTSIFYHNNPLHDGGVIIEGNEITCSGAIFPISESPNISKRLGTRHHAALGIAEETDALAIVLSEETGRISLALDGNLLYNIQIEEAKNILIKALEPTKKISITTGGETK